MEFVKDKEIDMPTPPLPNIKKEKLEEQVKTTLERKKIKEELEGKTQDTKISKNEDIQNVEVGSYTPIVRSLGNILGEVFCPKFKFDDDEVRQIDENLTVIFGKTSSRLMAVLSIILILASKYLACVKLWRETKTKIQDKTDSLKKKIYGDGT